MRRVLGPRFFRRDVLKVAPALLGKFLVRRIGRKETALMITDAAVNIVFKGELERSADKDAARKDYINEYREKFATPYKAAELGYIDEVIRPRQTRKKLIRSLHMLKNKRQDNPPKKHGNIPL